MKTKLDEFIKRNRARNAHLYDSGLILGIDYIVCPASGEHLSMIKSSYIEKVLGMTVVDYDRIYPGVRGVCSKRTDNIKAGLSVIDKLTGLTKYELGQVKARAVLQQLDESGMSGYDRKGQATRATHMANIDEMGRNGYAQLAATAIVKGNNTKSKKGLILHPGVRSEFYRYKSTVTYLTEKHRKLLSAGYVTGLAGVFGAYHIDHQYSIMHGYTNNISPLVIGHINNLAMIPWKDNLQKHVSSSITLAELFLQTNYTKEKSDNEFNIIIGLIREQVTDSALLSAGHLLEKLYATTLS